MYPSVKLQIPDFIEEYMVYSDCFTDINKQKSCWLLTRNLKFFEFCRKQLVASIDLQTTCLNKIKPELINYKGPKGKWYENSTSSPSPVVKQQNHISLGKYIFHALNVHKIYVIIHCWDKCVILKKLPEFKGFEIKEEYENLESYDIIHGTIKFCPMLELKFSNGDSLKTDFEETVVNAVEEDVLSKNAEMRQLLERIRCAKAELELHKSITAKTFNTLQNNLTFGQPFLRGSKQEEKQILGRCGDIWKRFTAHDDLVIGVPLVNQCAVPNLSIVRNVKPVLKTNESIDSSVEVYFRLYQLKLKFEQLDEVETFLECEDEELQEKVWCDNEDMQLLPESFAVLLIKMKISQIISLKESPLILTYEVYRHLDTATDSKRSTFIVPLQLFLQNLDFHKLLFEERQQNELTFMPQALHQDFLTIAITSQLTNLEIVFKSFKDMEIFENFLQKRLDFLKPNQSSFSLLNNLVFYNSKTSSQWFGSLILRSKILKEDDEEQCLTKWKVYCQNYDKTLYFIKTLLNESLLSECNISSIKTADERTTTENIVKLQNNLRQELNHLQEISCKDYDKSQVQRHLGNLEKLFKLQVNTDIIASEVFEN